MLNFKKILIAVDSSAYSIGAARVGFQLAYALDAEVALVFVIDRAKESVSSEAGPTSKQSEVTLLKEAQDTIEQLARMYNGAKSVYRFTPEGFPRDEIINTANEWEADVLVMGAHAGSGLAHLFRESIAEHVVKHACVPVLLIPPGMK